MDAGGGSVLSDYLKQLEAQQALVREMIANQKVLLKSGKVAPAGMLQHAAGKSVRANTLACPKRWAHRTVVPCSLHAEEAIEPPVQGACR